MPNDSIEQIKSKLLEDITRYQMNLEIILAIKSLIKEKYPEIRVLSPERKVIIDNPLKKKTPDLIIHNEELNFLINENKTSIAPEENNLNKISEQLSEYMNISAVLDENGNQINVNDFSVNLLVNIESYDEIKDFFLSYFSNNSKFSIMTFSRLESVRREGMRYYLFELRDNSTIIEEINELFSSRPMKYLIDFQKDGEEIYFTTDPPSQYTIIILWMYILPVKINENGNFTVNDIETTIRKYYGKWDRSRTFFKITWIKEALQNLCDMEWIKKVSADNYQIVKTLNLSGDVHEIICFKLAKLIYEREIEEMGEIKIDKKAQLSLFDFVKNDSNN